MRRARTLRTRRLRRRAKAVMAHGKKAVRKHKRKTGRTGSIFSKRTPASRARDRHPEGDDTQSGSVERSEIEPGRDSDAPKGNVLSPSVRGGLG